MSEYICAVVLILLMKTKECKITNCLSNPSLNPYCGPNHGGKTNSRRCEYHSCTLFFFFASEVTHMCSNSFVY
jgi:hypothetical protein